MNKILIVILLVAGGIAGYFISKYVNRPPKQPPVFERLIGAAELVLAKNDVHKVYTICPKIPVWKDPVILIIWRATLEYELDLKQQQLVPEWSADSSNLTVKAPAIQLKTPTIHTDEFYAVPIKSRWFVNEAEFMLAELMRTKPIAYNIGLESLKDGRVAEIVRAELRSFVRNILIGLNVKIPEISVEFAQSELPEPLPVEIAYCKDFDNIPRPLSKIITPTTATMAVATDTSTWKDKWSVSVFRGNK
jgi:hypothetical protein